MAETGLPDIFKAYDIRGIVPDELRPELAYEIGRAYVSYMGGGRFAVGRDMRVSSPELAAALIRGMTDQGADVTDIGQFRPTRSILRSVSTDSTAAA
ncbi:MAG: hypothetical protein R3A46_05985 [Thermomicrobiales bacterium]